MAEVHIPDLPEAIPFDNVARALAVLGIPIEGVRSVELGTRVVTVTQIVRQSKAFRTVATEIPVDHKHAEPTGEVSG